MSLFGDWIVVDDDDAEKALQEKVFELFKKHTSPRFTRLHRSAKLTWSQQKDGPLTFRGSVSSDDAIQGLRDTGGSGLAGELSGAA